MSNNHPEEKRREFVLIAFETGSIEEAAKKVGISYSSAKVWSNSEWYKEWYGEYMRRLDQKMDERASRIIEKALKQIDDNIDNGETIWDSKSQSLVKKPVSTRDLMIVAGISYDKREKMRASPAKAPNAEEVLLRIMDAVRQVSKDSSKYMGSVVENPESVGEIPEKGRAVSLPTVETETKGPPRIDLNKLRKQSRGATETPAQFTDDDET